MRSNARQAISLAATFEGGEFSGTAALTVVNPDEFAFADFLRLFQDLDDFESWEELHEFLVFLYKLLELSVVSD